MILSEISLGLYTHLNQTAKSSCILENPAPNQRESRVVRPCFDFRIPGGRIYSKTKWISIMLVDVTRGSNCIGRPMNRAKQLIHRTGRISEIFCAPLDNGASSAMRKLTMAIARSASLLKDSDIILER